MEKGGKVKLWWGKAWSAQPEWRSSWAVKLLQRAYCKQRVVQKPGAPGSSLFFSHVTSTKHRDTVTYFVSFPFLTRLNRPLPAYLNWRGGFGSDNPACFFLPLLISLPFLNESLRRWRTTCTVALAVLAPTVIRSWRVSKRYSFSLVPRPGAFADTWGILSKRGPRTKQNI